MYTRIPSHDDARNPIAIPENYSGVTFTQANDAESAIHTQKTAEDVAHSTQEDEVSGTFDETATSSEARNANASRHDPRGIFSLFSRGGEKDREDMLLLVLALLLIEGDMGDEALGMMLLTLLFLG